MSTLKIESNKFEFYSADEGSTPQKILDIGIFSKGMINEVNEDVPIRLQRGDPYWGAIHIVKEHGHWLKRKNLSACEMVCKKIHQSGKIFSTEEAKKFKLSLRNDPDALLVLRLMNVSGVKFFTVVSVYAHPASLDGEELGPYTPKKSGNVANNGVIPVFSLPNRPANTEIIYKKKFRY